MNFAGDRGSAAHRRLFEDPRFFVFDTLPKKNLTRFLVTDEKELATAPFADIRFDNPSREEVFARSHALLNYAQKHASRKSTVFFIFHHAFVCSTLLARCLNEIDAFFALKEPWILRRMADWKRSVLTTAGKRDWNKKGKMYLRLLAKKYDSGDSLVVKPTNVANNLIGDVCRWLPDTKVLYLYSGLESFLVSNIKKNNATKAKLPSLLNAFLMDSQIATRCAAFTDFQNLTFLQTCAAIWIANIFSLQEQYAKNRTPNVRTINMDTFLQSPPIALTEISRFFDHAPTSSELTRMTSPDVMGFHAKALVQRRYDRESRAREYRVAYGKNVREIKTATRWAAPMIDHLELMPFLREIELV